MRQTRTIEGKPFDLASNAFTPIFYRQLFKRDFLVELNNFRALKGKKAKDFTSEELQLYTDRSEAFARMAFCMNKQAEIGDILELQKLTINDFYSWLSIFENPSVFTTAEALNAVLSTWTNNTAQLVEGKNAESREIES